jgi:hypothetical protein
MSRRTNTEKKERRCISLSPSTLKAMDVDRGQLERSAYINYLLTVALGTDEQLKGLMNFAMK